MTLLLRLRERAKQSRHGEWRAAALSCADKIAEAIDYFQCEPTDDNLAKLNGIWAVGHRILNHYPDEPEPISPKTNVMELRKAA